MVLLPHGLNRARLPIPPLLHFFSAALFISLSDMLNYIIKLSFVNNFFKKIFFKKIQKSTCQILEAVVYYNTSVRAEQQKLRTIRGSVGTGRRARLRILWWLHRVGSSPIFRIKPGFVRVQAFYFSDPLPLHSIPSNKNQPGRKRVLTHAQPGFSFPSFKKSHFSTPSPRPLP